MDARQRAHCNPVRLEATYSPPGCGTLAQDACPEQGAAALPAQHTSSPQAGQPGHPKQGPSHARRVRIAGKEPPPAGLPWHRSCRSGGAPRTVARSVLLAAGLPQRSAHEPAAARQARWVRGRIRIRLRRRVLGTGAVAEGPRGGRGKRAGGRRFGRRHSLGARFGAGRIRGAARGAVWRAMRRRILLRPQSLPQRAPPDFAPAQLGAGAVQAGVPQQGVAEPAAVPSCQTYGIRLLAATARQLVAKCAFPRQRNLRYCRQCCAGRRAAQANAKLARRSRVDCWVRRHSQHQAMCGCRQRSAGHGPAAPPGKQGAAGTEALGGERAGGAPAPVPAWPPCRPRCCAAARRRAARRRARTARRGSPRAARRGRPPRWRPRAAPGRARAALSARSRAQGPRRATRVRARSPCRRAAARGALCNRALGPTPRLHESDLCHLFAQLCRGVSRRAREQSRRGEWRARLTPGASGSAGAHRARPARAGPHRRQLRGQLLRHARLAHVRHEQQVLLAV